MVISVRLNVPLSFSWVPVVTSAVTSVLYALLLLALYTMLSRRIGNHSGFLWRFPVLGSGMGWERGRAGPGLGRERGRAGLSSTPGWQRAVGDIRSVSEGWTTSCCFKTIFFYCSFSKALGKHQESSRRALIQMKLQFLAGNSLTPAAAHVCTKPSSAWGQSYSKLAGKGPDTDLLLEPLLVGEQGPGSPQ